jgi:ribonucleoside-diphosphate reductase beta chain
VTDPTDERYLNDDYVALFDAVEESMAALLDDRSPEARARAYSHYHIVAESVLAQTAYYSLQSAFSSSGDDDVVTRPRSELPDLDGLVEGIARIRSDEGRHVGFGMHQVRNLIQEEDVDETVVREVLTELMPHVAGIFTDIEGPVDHGALVAYARKKLTRRLDIITEADAEVPPVDDLVAIERAG